MRQTNRVVHLRSIATILVVVGVLSIGISARADIVDEPPADCPSGSSGSTCHGGPYCALNHTCIDESDCGDDETCEEIRFCIEQIDCASGWTPPGEHLWRDNVEGTCDDGCSSGDCETRTVCVAPDSSLRAGCSCRTGETHLEAGALLLALIPALILLGMRRSRAGR